MTLIWKTLVGWLLLAALVMGIGAVLSRIVVAPRAAVDPRERSAMYEAIGRLASVVGIALPVALALFFVRQLAEFRDPFAPLSEDVALLLSTPWAETWRWGLVASVVAGVGLVAARGDRKWAWWVAGLALAPLSAFPALTGHAAGEAELRGLAILADVLHVLAASGWMGVLGSVLYMEASWRSREPVGTKESLLPQLVPAFSPVAVACVAVLVATGTFASWLHVGDWADLVGTGYGRTLGLKLLLVAIVMALGGMNWKRLTPLLGSSEGNDALRRAAALELLVAQLVLFVTAVLVRTSPSDM